MSSVPSPAVWGLGRKKGRGFSGVTSGTSPRPRPNPRPGWEGVGAAGPGGALWTSPRGARAHAGRLGPGRAEPGLRGTPTLPPSCVLTSLFQVSHFTHLHTRIFLRRGSRQRPLVSEPGFPGLREEELGDWGAGLLGLREEEASHLDICVRGKSTWGPGLLDPERRTLGLALRGETQTPVYQRKKCVRDLGTWAPGSSGPLAGTAGPLGSSGPLAGTAGPG